MSQSVGSLSSTFVFSDKYDKFSQTNQYLIQTQATRISVQLMPLWRTVLNVLDYHAMPRECTSCAADPLQVYVLSADLSCRVFHLSRRIVSKCLYSLSFNPSGLSSGFSNHFFDSNKSFICPDARASSLIQWIYFLVFHLIFI